MRLISHGRLARAVELGKEKAMTVDPSSTRLNGIAPRVVYPDKHVRPFGSAGTFENINLRLPCVDVISL